MESKLIWAKSKLNKKTEKPFTLSEHTNDVLKAFESLKKNIPEKSKYLESLIKISIFLHDLGKCFPRFQIFVLKNKNYLPFDLSSNIYHSLFSVLWINQDKLEKKIKSFISGNSDDYLKIILSAVAYHHWKNSIEDQIRFGSNDFEKFYEKFNDNGNLQLLQNNLKSEIEKFSENFNDVIGFNLEMLEGLSRGVSFAEYAIPPYQLYWLPKRQNFNPDDKINKDWIFISGFLIRSDHFASFCEGNDEDVKDADKKSISYDQIKLNIVNAIGTDEKKIWQIKEAATLQDENVILVAPTGSGKTEFSFLWAGANKFFYTLPLRSAVNQIYDRAKRIFEDSSEDKVGLLHSDADVYLLNDEDESDNIKIYETSKQLSYPAIVSTGDQFFPYALRPPGFEKVFATFSYSRLIIDEVQAYDPKAAAIVVKFIQDIVRMGGKFLLMTATLPSFILKKLEELSVSKKEEDKNKKYFYNEKNIYLDKKNKLESFTKHYIKTILIKNERNEKKTNFNLEDDYIEQIAAEAKKGKRVLVILNTVKQAQAVYEEVKEKMKENVWLLHSRFSFSDRKKKEFALCGGTFEMDSNLTKLKIFRNEVDVNVAEGNFEFSLNTNQKITLKYAVKSDNEIKKIKIFGLFQNPKPIDENVGKILIATQVIEASLDLDADVLFTELAPLDSLVQRMGRILRRYQLDFDGNKINKNGDTQELPNEPNIFIWVFQNGLESGNGRVYENELLYKTLLFFSKSEKDFELINTMLFDKKKEIVIDQVEDVELEQPTKRKKKDSAKKKGADIILSSTAIEFSEYKKYESVNELYENLSDQGYLKKFNDMVVILDSGYMSDRKEEAQKMFREIATIQAIPLEMEIEGKMIKSKEKLKTIIENFFIENKGKDHLYTYFKKEILANFVINIHPKRNIQNDNLSEWIKSELFEDNKRLKEKASRWTKGIYFVSYDYNSKSGIGSEQKDNDDNFL